MLLIIGIMIGYLASSVISILNYYSSTDRVHAFVMWGLGNFSGVSLEQLPFFGTCALIGLLLAVLLIKPLNALLLGEMYAANLGIRIKPGTICPPFMYGDIDRYDYRFLRTDLFYRISGSAYLTADAWFFQS